MVNTIEQRDELLRTAAEITMERVKARAVVEELRTSLKLVWQRELPDSWRTAGLAQELIDAAVEVLEGDPRQSLVFAQLALAVATGIPAGAYPALVIAQLEGSAWKEIGTAHRYLSEYDAALRAYDCAQRSFETSGAMVHDRAVVDFSRAIVLSDLGRHDEARRLLANAVTVLRGFGDVRRVAQAMMLAGMIQHRQGQLREARASYESALREVAEDDLHARATLRLNLGQVQAELGETNEAMLMLYQAHTLFAEMNMPGEVTRTDWALARALLRGGEAGRAVPVLQRAREDFLARSMPEEAGLAGLDLVEARLAMGEHTQARNLTECVLGEFRDAKLNRRAITALAYLRDILSDAKKSDRAVHHVRTYIEELRREPARAFLPLPE